MRRHLMRVMPKGVQHTLIHQHDVSCADIVFQALVDAGPGTEADRTITLQSVVSKGGQVAPREVYDRLHKWRFDMQRLCALGVCPPDPSVQRNVLVHFVSKMAESDREFDYRLNAYRLTRNLQGGVTQSQVDELWRYLVAEAREVHGFVPEGVGHKSAKKVKSPEQPKEQDKPEDAAKRMEDTPAPKAKATGVRRGRHVLHPRCRACCRRNVRDQHGHARIAMEKALGRTGMVPSDFLVASHFVEIESRLADAVQRSGRRTTPLRGWP